MFTRRTFFGTAVGALAFAQQKRDMKVLSTRPEDLEMPLSGFSDYITPIEHFFVRTHVYEPKVDIASWRLKVDGVVGTPLTLTIDDIRKMPSVELIAVTECAGNGRGFYEPTVPGLQWTNGSVGNGRWRGVRLADVLKRAGVQQNAVEVLFDGADVPIGTMQDFRRSIPIAKALNENTLLAYEMNGVALPPEHGFPMRVVTPGWASDSWVKWLTGITVLDKEWDGFWMKNSYRHPGHAVAPGTAVPPDQMQPVTSLRIKSVITSVPEQVGPGSAVTIRGVAWSGDQGPVTGVQVSVDNGRTWRLADLARDQFTQFGWRQWSYEWHPREIGYATIIARANDANGNTQPMSQEWNPSGYGWNVAARASVNVGGSALAAPAAATAANDVGLPRNFGNSCVTCHGMDTIQGQKLTRAQWDREITKMQGWGAQVNSEDRDRFLDFLSSYFGPRK
jgi:DMSO/TMAO reductase YedYZ molybdopterin-dependent catalytic subunit/mono/diheme cytochrome c family protein